MQDLLYKKLSWLVIISLLMAACQMTTPTPRARDITGTNIQTGLLIFFKSEVTNPEIGGFWNNVLSVPHPDGHGFDLRPGIMGISAGFAVDGHSSVTVDFWPDATKEQRDAVINDVKASPLVYKAMENVVPSSIKTVN